LPTNNDVIFTITIKLTVKQISNLDFLCWYFSGQQDAVRQHQG